MANNDKKILVFLETHPVFTLEELRYYFSISNGSREASDLVLNNRRMGRIGALKAGLYFVVRPGNTEKSTQVDPFLLTAKLARDAVLAFHTALEVLGFNHSSFNSYYYYSSLPHSAILFRKDHFRCILFPEYRQKKPDEIFGIEKIERSGLKINVTVKERTLVDVLERYSKIS
jgi:predicted transcriptional regulator of viral defense system